MLRPVPDDPTATHVNGLGPGTRVAGRYLLRELLGRGGMGVVFRALDEHLEEPVAVKVLHRAIGDDPDTLKQLRREVRVARRVSHPHVARIHDLGQHADVHFLTMEVVDGVDLSRIYRGRLPLPADVAAAILAPVAEGVAAAHDAGVVHRDLKPSNILLDRSGRVVVTDFGLARQFDDRSLFSSGLVGTPLYMAPEQVSGGRLGPFTDVYALGLLLYEALTGQLPFRRPTPLATAVARVSEPVPDPSSLDVPLPEGALELLRACLSREAAARPTAGELSALLGGWGAATREALSTLVTGVAEPDEDAETQRFVRLDEHRTLLVLPFRCRSDPELGEELAESLVDLLASTRGMSVLAPGAALGVSTLEARDPRALGKTLGVDAVVEGAIRRLVDGTLSVRARLADASTGLLLWSEKIDSRPDDDPVLAEERLAKRIAESLRLGLQTAAYSDGAPPAAFEPYLRARRRLLELQFHGSDGAVADLERALALAPDFGPALAAHAIGSVRAWFIPGLGDRDWETVARSSVARALARAPNLPETQLAAAMLAVQDAEHGLAAEALETALDLAPTYAEAHEYFGRLLCEVGREDRGLSHLRTAVELDPTLHRCLVDVARTEALRGDRGRVDAAIEELERRAGAEALPAFQARLRDAAWRGDEAAIRRDAMRLAALGPAHRIAVLYAEALLGKVPVEQALATLRAQRDGSGNRRFRAFLGQLGAEVAAARGAEEEALALLAVAVDDGLIDLLWLDRCPLLAGLRERAGYASIREGVATRAQAVV
jgi:TolB-like protein